MHRLPPTPFCTCRNCGAILAEEVADLGLVPLSPAPLRIGEAAQGISAAPLRVLVCGDCRLVQLACGVAPSPNTARGAVDGFAGVIAARLRLGPGTPVAAFDPAALGPFRDRDIPASAVPAGALSALRLRDVRPPPVLLLCGALMATATDLHDALAGVRTLLAPGGVAIFDTPDLMALLHGNRFDLLSHALPVLPSVLVAEMVLGQHGLVPFDLESRQAQGPWLRLLVRHAEDATKPVAATLLERRHAERTAGLEGLDAYRAAAVAVAESRLAVVDLLVAAKRDGRTVAGYGAGPAAAMLAAACGIGPGLLCFTVDPACRHAGLSLPGSQVPILPLGTLDLTPPDLLLLLDGTPAEAARAGLARHRGRPWTSRVAAPLPGLRVS